MRIIPRDYQVESIDAVARAVQRGVREVLVVLPTGAGKTIVMGVLCRRRGGRGIILAHRDELISQAAAKIRMVIPDRRVGIVAAERNETDADIIVASVQTLANESRRAQLPAADFLLIDEAHHATAKSYRQVIETVQAKNDRAFVVGVTATPDRSDGLAVVGEKAPFKEVVYERSIADFLPHVRPDGLCDLVTLQIALADYQLDGVAKAGKDFSEKALADTMSAIAAVPRIVGAWRTHAADRKTVAFFPSVALAYEAARAWNEAGFPAAAIDGTLDRETRRRILRDFADDNIRILTNCNVATEGFDEPSVECVLVARPTLSRALYAQMVGRGLRLFPGKKNCLVLDVVGISSKHSLVGVADLFDLDAGALADGTSVVEALTKPTKYGPTKTVKKDARIRVATSSRPVDAFGQFTWVKTSGGNWVLSVGKTFFNLERDGEDLWKVSKNGFVIARELTQSYALGLAESEARQLAKDEGALTLIQPKAKWRKDPASSKQLDTLLRMGVRIPEGITKGQAADLITAKFAEKRSA